MTKMHVKVVIADARRVNYCFGEKLKYGILKCIKMKWNRIFSHAKFSHDP